MLAFMFVYPKSETFATHAFALLLSPPVVVVVVMTVAPVD